MGNNKSFEGQHGEVSLARKVGRMGMLIHRYYDALAHQHGAAGDPLRGQGRVLALLKAKPTTTQRELSFLLDMRQQSLSELLAKLEEKGFVERVTSKDDRRTNVIRLADDAVPVVDECVRKFRSMDALLMAGLSDEDQERLMDLLERLLANAEAARGLQA